METQLLQPNSEGLQTAANLLRQGQLVAIPTETVYGLAADALNPTAVASIFAAKDRPMDNPLIVHIADMADWAPLVTEITPAAMKLAEAYWPGPLTLILPAAPCIPNEVRGGLDTVAVRFPSHPIAQAAILHAGCPLAAPSANRSGAPSPTNAPRVMEDMTGRIAAVLDGGDSEVGVESTVIDMCHIPPRLLRPGGITPTMLEEVIGPIDIDKAVTHQLEMGATAASPGMKYKHYAPKADISIVLGNSDVYTAFVNAHAGAGVTALCFDEDAEKLTVPTVCYGSRYDDLSQAHQLFDALRHLDEISAKTVYAACPSVDGVGLAVYNRLIRAAAFRFINPIRVIGLTGPTGAGKSTAAAAWQTMGAAIIDTDRLAREVVAPGSPCLTNLAATFGQDILLADGTLHRKVLAQRAFSTAENSQKLNAITHPAIVALTKQRLDEAVNNGYTVAVIDAPLLFEAGVDALCDCVVAVTAPAETRLTRIMARDSIDETAARQRMAAQQPDSFYARDGVTLLENRSTPEELSSDAIAWLTEQKARWGL